MEKKLYAEEGNVVKGAKVKKPFYKRWWFILLVVLVIGGALAGGDEDTTSEEATAEEPETEEVVDNENLDEEEQAEIAEQSTNDIVIGEPMKIGEYTLTVTGYELVKDYEDKDALVINYDWENNSDEEASPFMTFIFKAFQDSVETDDVFVIDGVDLGIGQKEIKAGGKIEGAQAVVGIDNLDEPLLLEVDELITFDKNPYSVELNLSELE